MTQEKYDILINAIETRTRDNGQEFYCLKDDTPEDIKKIIHDILFECDEPLDQAYTMMNDALNFLADHDMKDLDTPEVQDILWQGEFASVYTADRLAYLNNGNQGEITDKLKEYDCDIQDACAVWYDEQVKDMVEQLKAKILKEND